MYPRKMLRIFRGSDLTLRFARVNGKWETTHAHS
jgi:hypothetical protein